MVCHVCVVYHDFMPDFSDQIALFNGLRCNFLFDLQAFIHQLDPASLHTLQQGWRHVFHVCRVRADLGGN
jgi:hypothetical protein